MTSATSRGNGESKRKIDVKFWTITVLAASTLIFSVTEKLLLDADEDDLRYAHLMIPASSVADPKPGDVFVFDHMNDAFEVSKFCSLQSFEVPKPVSEVLTASNVWGSIINDAVSGLGDYIGDKVAAFAKVQNAEREWVSSKFSRKASRAPMKQNCLDDVVAALDNPVQTPFIVDATYEIVGAKGTQKWVRFASPPMKNPATCGATCPKPKNLQDIVKPGPFARFKAKWHIVRFD